MNVRFLVAAAWLLLHLSAAFHEYRKRATMVDEPIRRILLPYVDVHTAETVQTPYYHIKVLVKYDTLVHYGAVVFSKPGVDTYSTIMIDNVKRTHYNSGIYLGARDWLIKFDQFFNETDAVEVSPSLEETENCKVGFPADDCHNYIKYIHIVDIFAVDQIFVCGTFAHSPACSVRLGNKLSAEINKIEGSFAPGNPRTGMAAYLSGNKLFLGRNMDSENRTTTILHTKLAKQARIIRTMENKGWLNKAEFVGAFSTSKNDKFVYYVFREIAIEAPTDNVIFSRVARICKEDEGGMTGHELEFGSFLKSYLDCGEYNKVQAISYAENDTYFWATFTSDLQNGSAICGFLISDVEAAFRGPFLQHDNETHKWEQCPPPYIQKGEEVAQTCFGYRSAEAVVNYTLMSDMIPHYCSRPSFVANAILNKIAVYSGKQDMFTAFAGDELGRVWKIDLMNCDWAEVVDLWEVVPADEEPREIKGLAIHNDSVIVLTHKTAMYILIQQYTGEIIVDPTTPATATSVSPNPLPSSPTTAPRNPSTSSTASEAPNNSSYSRLKCSCSHAALFLTSTALICV